MQEDLHHLSSRFWAKTLAADLLGGAAYKPVLHHLLDVAAAAYCLLQAKPGLLRRLAVRYDVPEYRLLLVLAFLAGLHDLGKISRCFQIKWPEIWPEDKFGPLLPVAGRSHWRNTALLLRAPSIAPLLTGLFPSVKPAYLQSQMAPLIAAIAGHHGVPPSPDDMTRDAVNDPDLGPQLVPIAAHVAGELARILKPEPLEGLKDNSAFKALSWPVAGLITLADWVGSDADFFGPQDPDMGADEYWPLALEAAGKAVREKGLCPPAAFAAPDLARVAPAAAISPRPLQQAAAELPLSGHPALVILEDTAGAGKTEAALVLAARMLAEGMGEGVFMALPTMATANAMYGRLAPVYRQFFEDGSSPSLVLAHGQASLSQVFRASAAQAATAILDPGADEQPVSAFCASWLADSRRKALLADVGAATIDQAFLAILRKKHLALRQAGLASHVLIVDEAHCFDAYMGEELERLLELHAMLGGSAIVLSATLAEAQKAAMLKAFAKGLGMRAPQGLDAGADPAGVPYPLITRLDAGTVTRTAPGTDPRLHREVTVRRAASREAVMQEALEAARQGAAVAIICNAVDPAICMFEALRQAGGVPVDLFHARMAQVDRQAIEAEVLSRFGKNAPQERRAGRTLVATQVIEQSLDLDFDLIFTDLAPVDLLIQRAGRLWRHMPQRPLETRPFAAPALVVLSADPDEVADAKWGVDVLQQAAFTYRRPAVLWRTARHLFDRGRIVSPTDMRPLIETVYDAGSWDDVPEPLHQAQQMAEGEEQGNRQLAKFNLAAPADGYTGLQDQLSSDEEIGTRLGEATLTLRIARMRDGKLVPLAEPGGPGPDAMAEAWALSALSCRKAILTRQGRDASPAPDAAEERCRTAARETLRRSWPEFEASIVIAILEEDGHLDAGPDFSRSLSYSRSKGLMNGAARE
ncbi:helicase Cas3 [Pannonibacter phragmitetus]|uniref:Helicase Cas3 n=1 Tax=Pannonibacter phragmitetus TaxID=121719 RepID=A0A378ZWX9_9HYPH|nr:CRISPR-associated helicase/endonuclease Cas3 [Pannonibacter phragmitetus]SUB01578.1 helicase Cas3 [Pannonibacter phragmitetus]